MSLKLFGMYPIINSDNQPPFFSRQVVPRVDCNGFVYSHIKITLIKIAGWSMTLGEFEK